MLHPYFCVHDGTRKTNFFQACHAASLLHEKQALAAQESMLRNPWPLSAELILFALRVGSVSSLRHQVGLAGELGYSSDTVGYITPRVFATGKPFLRIDRMSLTHT